MVPQKFIPEFIFSKILKALKKLFNKDFYLFEKKVAERTISHKFAGYLQEEFGTDLFTDCEYNRHFDHPKRLYEIKKHVASQRANKTLSNHEEDYGICVSPDIIVHKRGDDGNNVLVLELKRNDNCFISDEKYDLLKIETYIKEFGYQYGAFINFKMGENFGIQKVCFLEKNLKDDCNFQDISNKFKRFLEKELEINIPE